MQPLIDAARRLLQSGRGFHEAVGALDTAFRCLVVVAEHQDYALREEAGWDGRRAAFLDAIAGARATARRSPSLKAERVPVFLVELMLAELELGLRALHDPKAGAEAAGAVAKIGVGVL